MPLVALMLFGGELGLPTIVPIEVAVLLVGSYSIPSVTALIGSLALMVIADVAGATGLYMAMRRSGRRLLARLFRHHGLHTSASLTHWRKRLGGRDVVLIFLGRLIPTVRMYVSMSAGLVDITPRAFLAGATPAAVVWAGIPLVTGYVFRGDVQHIVDGFTRAEHILIIVLIVAAIITAVIWWVRERAVAWQRVRLGRAVVGLVAVLVVVVYLVAILTATDQAITHGAADIPLAAVAAWLGLLTVLAVGLLLVALADLRAARRKQPDCEPPGRAELMSTLAWVALLSIVAAVMVGLELHYPGL